MLRKACVLDFEYIEDNSKAYCSPHPTQHTLGGVLVSLLLLLDAASAGRGCITAAAAPRCIQTKAQPRILVKAMGGIAAPLGLLY